ncbi:Ribosomal subunit interface protein [Clostridiaceae bacterium JG1575]|nr:Ribosomal subunit interface protein [Clostridiaceae bacterium JG1575]
MNVSIFARDMKPAEGMEDLIEKKLSRLDKYFKSDVDAKVTLSAIKRNQKVEVLIPFNGLYLRAEETTDDMHKAVDRVVEKLERQLRKNKTRIEKRHTKETLRNPSFNAQAFAEPEGGMDEEEQEKQVVRTKTFELKPMTEDEAILQMELLGHNFYVYDDLSGNTCVLYRRNDGNYGLIERSQE